jgi:hypothetical protein
VREMPQCSRACEQVNYKELYTHGTGLGHATRRNILYVKNVPSDGGNAKPACLPAVLESGVKLKQDEGPR